MPYVRARLNKSDLILALPDLQDAIFHWIFLVCPRLHVSIELRPRIRNLPSGIGVEKWEYWTMIRSESAVVDSGGRVRVASQLETSPPPPPPPTASQLVNNLCHQSHTIRYVWHGNQAWSRYRLIGTNSHIIISFSFWIGNGRLERGGACFIMRADRGFDSAVWFENGRNDCDAIQSAAIERF